MSRAARQTDAVLGLETATGYGGVALWSGGRVVAETLLYDPRSLAERLFPALEFLLEQTGRDRDDLSAVAVSSGPGSFTGLRIGVAAAKGLAFALGVPLYGIPTLEVLAAGAMPSTALLCAVIDARRGELFSALFRCDGGEPVRVGPERILSPEALVAGLETGTVIVGEPPPPLRDLLERKGGRFPLSPPGRGFPRASVVASRGEAMREKGLPSQLDSLLPFYLRPSDAEANVERKRRLKIDRDGRLN